MPKHFVFGCASLLILLCMFSAAQGGSPANIRWSQMPNAIKKIMGDLRATKAPHLLQASDDVTGDRAACIATFVDPVNPWVRLLDVNPNTDSRSLTLVRGYAKYLIRNDPSKRIVYQRSGAYPPTTRGFVTSYENNQVHSILVIHTSASQKRQLDPARFHVDLIIPLIADLFNDLHPRSRYETGPSAERILDVMIAFFYSDPRFMNADEHALETDEFKLNLSAIRQDKEYQDHLIYARGLLNLFGYDPETHVRSQKTGIGASTVLYDMSAYGYPFQWVADQGFMDRFAHIAALTKHSQSRAVLFWDAKYLIDIADGEIKVVGY